MGDETFEQKGPGKYEASIDAEPGSLCVVTVYSETSGVVASGEAWVSASLESGPEGPDMEELSRIAVASGGEILTENTFLDNSPEGRGERRYEIWWILLILAGCFFIADIAHGSILTALKFK